MRRILSLASKRIPLTKVIAAMGPCGPPPLRGDHCQGTHTAASRLTSHTRHDDNQAGNGPRRTTPPSLTVP
jgi:hypothetical protein